MTGLVNLLLLMIGLGFRGCPATRLPLAPPHSQAHLAIHTMPCASQLLITFPALSPHLRRRRYNWRLSGSSPSLGSVARLTRLHHKGRRMKQDTYS